MQGRGAGCFSREKQDEGRSRMKEEEEPEVFTSGVWHPAVSPFIMRPKI